MKCTLFPGPTTSGGRLREQRAVVLEGAVIPQTGERMWWLGCDMSLNGLLQKRRVWDGIFKRVSFHIFVFCFNEFKDLQIIYEVPCVLNLFNVRVNLKDSVKYLLEKIIQSGNIDFKIAFYFSFAFLFFYMIETIANLPCFPALRIPFY